MKKMMITALTLVVLLTSQAFAAGDKIKVNVSGLVCDFCAQAIEKVFGEHEAVEMVKVDLDNSQILIDYKEGQSLDQETIKTLVNDAGYTFDGIEPRGAE